MNPKSSHLAQVSMSACRPGSPRSQLLERHDEHFIYHRQLQIDLAGRGHGPLQALRHPVIGMRGHALVEVSRDQRHHDCEHPIEVQLQGPHAIASCGSHPPGPASTRALTTASLQRGAFFSTCVTDGANPLLNAGEEAVLQDWREKG